MPSPPQFTRPHPRSPTQSSSLYVANVGPAVGIAFPSIAAAFSAFGEVKGVYAADDTGARVIVSFADEESAGKALRGLDGRGCFGLGGRVLHVGYSVPRPPVQVEEQQSVSVSLTASELNIPGAYLYHDFITKEEEEKLMVGLGCVLQKEEYSIMVLERISTCSELDGAGNIGLDQLTVNEYPSGVGLSPHIDTHSAFENAIFSLSLAGSCIMELRRSHEGNAGHESGSGTISTEKPEDSVDFLRKAIFLPPRSLLVLSGEARYAWHHYIPHHKVDSVNGSVTRRSSRRVSLTFRKVRRGPCCCEYVAYCDSRR